MELEIRRQDAHLDAAMREFVERRIAFALRPFENRVSRVTVNLDDVNGPRGGVDKQCRRSVKQGTNEPTISGYARRRGKSGWT